MARFGIKNGNVTVEVGSTTYELRGNSVMLDGVCVCTKSELLANLRLNERM